MRENLKATKSFTYGGRFLTAGAEFTAPRADAKVLRSLGRAAPAQTYETIAAAAEVTKETPSQLAPKASEPKAAAKATPKKGKAK